MPDTFNTTIKKVQALAVELAADRQFLRESDDYLRLEHPDKLSEIENLEAKKAEIDNQIAQIRLAITESDPENSQAVEDAENRASRLEKEIKGLCHSLPAERLAKRGVKISDNDEKPRITIVVSKGQVEERYNSAALIAAHPELNDLKVDGDSVVERSVVPEILSRLVEEGRVDESVYTFRELVLKRAPSVRINNV